MFFYILICIVASPSGNNYTGILEDPKTTENMDLRISLFYDKTKTFGVDKLILDFLRIWSEQVDWYAILLRGKLYYKEVKNYTDKKYHTVLLYFTAFVCEIIYFDTKKADIIHYKPELLFNLICFGRFLEFIETDKNMITEIEKTFKDFVV
ncbi:hypothetical protein LUQ84_002472 [Hamiltosporidium tvaerminnensis]|nr:hypothetical protein LUQ84_002472 [Hamiltosporidium tvaerminnensis]